MAKLSDREILSMVDQEFESAMGSSDGEISIERANAWRYYNSEPIGNEVAGKSSMVSSDVSDVVDGIMPSLLRLFSTKDNLITFEAQGAEDEELAAQETDYTSYVFFKKNENSFMTLYNWFFDALVQKNGIVKAWWDESEVITEESYTNLTEPEVFKLLADEELEAVERDESVGETIINNQPVTAVLHDIKFKRTTKKRQVKVESVPPEEYRISSDSTQVNPSSARMVGQESLIKRSTLLEMGFDPEIVDRLPAEDKNWDSEELIARRGLDEERTGRPDKSQEEIKTREAFIKLDLEGDGRSELRQVFTSNGQLLANDPADRQPFHVLTSKPLPHKHFGTCVAELVMDIQKVNTTLTRQILDNLYQTNNPGHAVYEQAIGETTMDDLLSTEIGGVTVFDRPVGESYAPMTTPFTAASAFPMLEYWDKVKRDRTGVHSDADALSPDQLKHIQTSVLSASMDQAKGKIELIARIFAETGIKSLFLHIHELLMKHQDKPQVARLRGKWVDIEPTAWRHRFDATVNIGIGIGSKETNLIHLASIKDVQNQMAATGGMNLTVSPKNQFNMAAEMVKNANLPDPEMFFTDPGNAKAPPPQEKEMQLQQQAQFLQQKEQELQAYEQKLNKVTLQHERDMLKIKQDGKQHDDDIMVDLQKLRNDLTEMELKYEKDVPEPPAFDYNPMTQELTRRGATQQ